MRSFTAQDWTVFFGSIGTLFAGIVIGVVKVLSAIQEVHLSVNSRMDELLREARKGALAEGRDQMRLSVDPAATIGVLAKPPLTTPDNTLNNP